MFIAKLLFELDRLKENGDEEKKGKIIINIKIKKSPSTIHAQTHQTSKHQKE